MRSRHARTQLTALSVTGDSPGSPGEGAVQPECRSSSIASGAQRDKKMKRMFGIIWIVAALGLSACGSATADKENADKNEAAKAAAAKPAPPKIIIPAGTSLHIR